MTETRFIPMNLEHRTEEGKIGLVSGNAILYDTFSVDLGGFIERVDRSALDRTLKENGPYGDILALYNHDPGNVIGRTSNETLKLNKTDTGLSVAIDLPDTTLGRDLNYSVKRKDLKGFSFGFRTEKDNWEMVGDRIIRTLLDIDLIEISIVSMPAYLDTQIDSRGIKSVVKPKLKVHKILQNFRQMTANWEV